MHEGLRFERFDKARHQRQLFDCGNTELTDFLKTRLNQQMKRGVHGIRIAVETAQKVASAVIEVDALDEQAKAFYERYGFATLPDDPFHLYLPIADAQALFQRVLGQDD